LLALQQTFKELMVKNEKAIAEREERRHKDKEATAKSFVDLQKRSIAADEAISKARLLEAEAKTMLLEVEAKLMVKKNKIMLTDLETIIDPGRRNWLEKKVKDDPGPRGLKGNVIDDCHS
jgi:hypothetical protein